jgi:putative membrane protein
MNPRYLAKLKYQWPVTIFIAVMHLAGLVGLFYKPLYPYFIHLVPFNLLATTTLLLYFHTEWNYPFYLFLIATYCVGYGVEVLGVHTGIPFGLYSYGAGLGYKVWDVPLVIGVNWVLLVYCSGMIAAFFRSFWIRVLVGAISMTALDAVIEPVAIYLDFWSWQAGVVPYKNYLGWFGTSFLLHVLFITSKFRKVNVVASSVWLIQVSFFLLSLLILRLGLNV